MQLINYALTSLLVRIQNLREEKGQTLVEYGLIVALLSIALIVALTTLSDELEAVFGKASSELGNAAS
ncbi:MAG TPA: Flp family type IVb pilin [Dehalococcoidia bacterium]|nr:Flp family type IVb pilin [Dehalococcoidia bacterium]